MSGTVEVFAIPKAGDRGLPTYAWRIRRPSGSVAAVGSQEFKYARDAADDCWWLHESHGMDIYYINGNTREKLT